MNKGYQSAQSTLEDLVDACTECNCSDRLLPYYSLSDRIDLYIFENTKIFKEQTGSNSLEEFIKREINKEFENKSTIYAYIYVHIMILVGDFHINTIH